MCKKSSSTHTSLDISLMDFSRINRYSLFFIQDPNDNYTRPQEKNKIMIGNEKLALFIDRWGWASWSKISPRLVRENHVPHPAASIFYLSLSQHTPVHCWHAF